MSQTFGLLINREVRWVECKAILKHGVQSSFKICLGTKLSLLELCFDDPQVNWVLVPNKNCCQEQNQQISPELDANLDDLKVRRSE